MGTSVDVAECKFPDCQQGGGDKAWQHIPCFGGAIAPCDQKPVDESGFCETLICHKFRPAYDIAERVK